jgi:hypothetical protein
VGENEIPEIEILRIGEVGGEARDSKGRDPKVSEAKGQEGPSVRSFGSL